MVPLTHIDTKYTPTRNQVKDERHLDVFCSSVKLHTSHGIPKRKKLKLILIDYLLLFYNFHLWT